MKIVKRIRKLPPWAIAIGGLSAIVLVAACISSWKATSFFSTPIGSFLSNMMAELVGLGVSLIVAIYVVDRFRERDRLARVAEQRRWYLQRLAPAMRCSLNSLCTLLRCPFLDRERLMDDFTVTVGREQEIREWLKGIKAIRKDSPLPLRDVIGIRKCLDIIENEIRLPRDEMLAFSQFFSDEPLLMRELSKVANNLRKTRVFWSQVTAVNYEGVAFLGHLGVDILDFTELFLMGIDVSTKRVTSSQ